MQGTELQKLAYVLNGTRRQLGAAQSVLKCIRFDLPIYYGMGEFTATKEMENEAQLALGAIQRLEEKLIKRWKILRADAKRFKS